MGKTLGKDEHESASCACVLWWRLLALGHPITDSVLQLRPMGSGIEFGPRSLRVVAGGGSGEVVGHSRSVSLRQPTLRPSSRIPGAALPDALTASSAVSGAGSVGHCGFPAAVGDGGPGELGWRTLTSLYKSG